MGKIYCGFWIKEQQVQEQLYLTVIKIVGVAQKEFTQIYPKGLVEHDPMGKYGQAKVEHLQK